MDAGEAPTPEQSVALALARDPALYDAWRAEGRRASVSKREDAWDALQRRAEKLMQELKEALTFEGALDQVIMTDEGATLYEQYRRAQGR